MRSTLLLLAATAAAAPVPALAASDGSTMRISAHVPLSCEIEADALTVDPESRVASGSAFEACNSSTAFVVTAGHRQLDTDEAAEISYAGQTRRVAAETAPASFARPGLQVGHRPVEVRGEDLRGPLTVTLSVTFV